jgi:methyltransferase (TIGR00027 family)
MAPNSPDQIQHVSDTALMVAACRAVETRRADGLVRDPFAERLAGPRGDAILHGITGWKLMCFGIGVRTRFLDDLIMETIGRESIEVVLSVGAGLDTRPWRLELPPGLRWIEADFPEMLSYKTLAMAAEEPKCRLERMAADVTSQVQREALFAAAAGLPTLMITEGLLMYLAGAAVEALAADAARHGIGRWLLDSSSLDLARRMGWDARRSVENLRAPGHLEGAALLDAVRSNGWSQLCFRSYSRDARDVAAERIAAMIRPYVEKGIPVPVAPVEDSSGVYLFGREECGEEGQRR